jgi:hypothetical protein
MIFETFARRKEKEARNGLPEVYTYDEAPEHLRHQVILALSEGIGRYHVVTGDEWHMPPNCNDIWNEIDRICQKEIFAYAKNVGGDNVARRFLNFLRVADVDDFLSAVEIGCVGLSCVNDKYNGMQERGARQTGVDAIDEINGRFEQHAVGYQFENRYIMRVDSKLTHSEIIKPALCLLTADC